MRSLVSLMTGRVRFAARDPGGANVLAALLSGGCGAGADVWAMPRAARVFERAGLACRVFNEDSDEAALERAWNENPVDTLVTGTSHYEAFEQVLWRQARRTGARSLALLDQWMNMPSRFTLERPDCVGALDEEQASELESLDFPRSAIMIVGHPWLALLRHTAAAPLTADHAAATRVLFVSEPIASDVRNGYNALFGFDEFDAFVLLWRVAARTAGGGTPVTIAVRFHPYEDSTAFLSRVDALGRIPGLSVTSSPAEEPAREWVQWADVVAGISSILLIEAMVLDRPVVSLQPGLSRENTFMPAVRGAASLATDAKAADTVVGPLLTNPSARLAALARQRAFVDALAGNGAAIVNRWIRDGR
jgi:hypothetical protein